MPKKFHFVASDTADARAALERLRSHYDDGGEKEADIVVALGGDGFMLQTLHNFLGAGLPIYGMNFGSVGFLMNEYRDKGLHERLEAAEPALVHPLRMTAKSAHGTKTEVVLVSETGV